MSQTQSLRHIWVQNKKEIVRRYKSIVAEEVESVEKHDPLQTELLWN